MDRTVSIAREPRFAPVINRNVYDDESVWAEFKGHCYTVIKSIGIGLGTFTSRITDKSTGLGTICAIVKLAGRVFEGIKWGDADLSNAAQSSFAFLRFADSLMAVVDLISLFELKYDEKGEVSGVQINRNVIKALENKEFFVIAKKVLTFVQEALTIPLFLSNGLNLFQLGTIAAKVIGKSILGVYLAYHLIALVEALKDIWEGRNPELACLKVICYTVEIALQIAIIASGIGMPAQVAMGVFSVSLDILIGTIEYHLNKQKEQEQNCLKE